MTGMAPWKQSGTLTADDKTLEYACFGPAPDQAPTIVLLHEGLGCVALWQEFPSLLVKETGCGVFVYSRAGYGQSDPVTLPRPLDYMTHEATVVLPQVLDAIGFRNGVLLGHSDGATIAAIFGGTVPDYRVRGLILMAPHFFTEPMGLAQIEQASHRFDTTDMPARMARYHRDPANAFNGWCDAWLDPGFRDWNVADVIDYLRIPVLAIQGRDDQYGTLAQIDEITTRSYAPVDLAILDDCRHAPFAERPDQTLSAVSEFIARLNRIEAAALAS